MAKKSKQQPFDKAFGGRMNAREITSRNPATPFGPGFTAPAQSGGSSTSNPIPVKPPTEVKYKGRKITAQPDVARVSQSKGGKIPLLTKPKPDNSNVKKM